MFPIDELERECSTCFHWEPKTGQALCLWGRCLFNPNNARECQRYDSCEFWKDVDEE